VYITWQKSQRFETSR